MKRFVLTGCLLVFCVDAFASGHDSGLSPVGSPEPQQAAKPAQKMPVEYPRVTGVSAECVDATVMSSYSPQMQFGLDGQQYALPAFAAEVIRRHGKESFRCLTVVASCRDASLLKQTFAALKPYGVTHISWQPDKKLFPNKTDKMPECQP
jgi:hypothetical protein